MPQADNLELAYGLLRVRLPDVVSLHDLMGAFELHGRHAAYTLEAITELGFLQRFAAGLFVRTSEGARLAASSEANAYALFIRRVLQLPAVRSAVVQVRANAGRKISKSELERIVTTASRRRYTGSTVGRRATTLLAWLLWLENNVWFVAPG